MKTNDKHNFLKIIIFTITLIANAFLPVTVSAAGTAIVTVSTPTSVNAGQQFTVDITVQPNNSIAGVQFNLSFNPSLVTVNSIKEGNLFKQGSANTYFYPGQIDNTAGTITSVFGTIIGPSKTVATTGTFATITLTAKTISGICPLSLSKVVVGNVNAQSVPLQVINGQVTVIVSNQSSVSPNAVSSVTTGGAYSTGGSSEGGGGWQLQPITGVGQVTLPWTQTGYILTSVTVISEDGKCTIIVPPSTLALTKEITPLGTITCNSPIAPTSPPTDKTIIAEYELGPSGVTFNPPITVTIIYDLASLPTGVTESNLILAFYDSTSGHWVNLDNIIVDTVSHTISGKTSHFTVFGIISDEGTLPTTTTPTATVSALIAQIPPTPVSAPTAQIPTTPVSAPTTQTPTTFTTSELLVSSVEVDASQQSLDVHSRKGAIMNWAVLLAIYPIIFFVGLVLGMGRHRINVILIRSQRRCHKIDAVQKGDE
jgi:hypothetical protein